MSRIAAGIALLLLLGATACSDKAKELYETAQFEELQTNHEHARQLYERILRDHGDSAYAGKAKERLDAISAPPAH